MIHKLRILPVLAIFAIYGSAFTPRAALAALIFDNDGFSNPSGTFGNLEVKDDDEWNVTKGFKEIENLVFEGTADASGFTDFYETITNNTGTNWTDFHVDLWIDPAAFNDGSVATINFNSASLGGDGQCSGIDATSTSLFCNGFNIGNGASLTLNFSVYVDVDDERRFSITERPSTVPEPTSLALLGLALSGLGFSRRKKALSIIA